MRTRSLSALGVFVRDYIRYRFGKCEHVRAHWRSFPFQLNLFN